MTKKMENNLPNCLSCEHAFTVTVSTIRQIQDRQLDARSTVKYPLEILLGKLSLTDNEPGKILQNLIKLDIVLILGQIFVVPQHVPELALTIQQLIKVAQEQLQFADVTTLLVLPNALHEDLVDGLKTGNKVTVHVLHLRVLRQQLSEVSVGVQVVVVTHEVLPQEDAGVETTTHLRVNLICIVHQLFQLLRQGHHPLSQGRQQLLHQVEILVKFAALHHHSLTLQVVERHLEINLLELLHEPFRLLRLVQLHHTNLKLQLHYTHNPQIAEINSRKRVQNNEACNKPNP